MDFRYFEPGGIDLTIGDGRQHVVYRRAEGPMHEHPLVHFIHVRSPNSVGDRPPRYEASTFPEEVFIWEESGEVFRYRLVGAPG